MDHREPSTSPSSPLALIGSEDAFAAFISALSRAPQLPHTDGLQARFKPCSQLWCVECLAHNLLMYTNRKQAFIAPTLSWSSICDIALRLTQPLLLQLATVNGSITEELFQAQIFLLEEKTTSLTLSEKLLTRVRATAIALLQWYSAHYFMLGKSAICVLPRLHWIETDSDQPEVDLFATGTMIAYNDALSAGRRYPFMAVYCSNKDASSLWTQLTTDQQQHWLASFTYLRSFRHAVYRGLPTRGLPQLISSADDKLSSGEENEEDTDDDS